MSAYKGDRPSNPLRFTPSMETPEENEADTNAGLIEQMNKISQTTFEHSGHAIRSVHAKSHGVLRGELTVLDALPRSWRRACSPSPAATPSPCVSRPYRATSWTTASPPRAAWR